MTSVMDLELAELILPLRRLKVRILNWPIPMANSAESARIPLIHGRFLCIIEELARFPRNQEERYQKISKIRTFGVVDFYQ